MRKILLILLLFIFSCNSKITYNPSSNQYVYSKAQFDSLCNADNLTKNLYEWTYVTHLNYETKKPQIRYFITRGDSVTYKIDYINNKYHCEILKLK